MAEPVWQRLSDEEIRQAASEKGRRNRKFSLGLGLVCGAVPLILAAAGVQGIPGLHETGDSEPIPLSASLIWAAVVFVGVFLATYLSQSGFFSLSALDPQLVICARCRKIETEGIERCECGGAFETIAHWRRVSSS